MADQQALSSQDRFEIFEQLNLHQRRIDTPFGIKSVEAYADLYWPEGHFIVNDLRHTDFGGFDGMKQMFDYAHSVFPIEKWFHTMGPFEIEGSGDQASARWRWIVNWKDGDKGVVSTGTYDDKFERRDGVWKCIERVSNIDPNWPAAMFQKYIDKEKDTSKIS